MVLPLMLLVAVSCQPATVEQQATTTGPDVEAVKAVLAQYCATVSAGDIETWVTLRTDDVVHFPPDAPPYVGMDELRPVAETILGENTILLTAQADEVVVVGDLAVMRASFEETITPNGEGEPTEMSGHWLLVLRKQPDSSWKVWRDMVSVVPPPPSPAM
jgi:ketosteroid isomerase-like protein